VAASKIVLQLGLSTDILCGKCAFKRLPRFQVAQLIIYKISIMDN